MEPISLSIKQKMERMRKNLTIQNTTKGPKPFRYNLHAYREYVKMNSRTENGYSRYANAQLNDFSPEIKFKIFRATKQGFYTQGPVGVGKTHLLHAHYRALPRLIRPTAERNETDNNQIRAFHMPGKRLFIPSVQLLSVIRDSYRQGSGVSENDLIRNYAKVRWLYIDDLGIEKPSEWAIQTLFMILNARYNDMLPTYFSSNLSLSEIAEKLSRAIASRIREMCQVVMLEGNDRRLARRIGN